MKKNLLFVITFITGSLCFGQKLKLTPDGFINVDTKQNFVVIERPTKPQKGMYEVIKNNLKNIVRSDIE